MKKTLIILMIVKVLSFYSFGQNKLSDTVILDESKIKFQEISSYNYVHTEANYTDSTGKGIIIQNGFPRGGGRIYSFNDISYEHAVFWSRVINKTDKPSKIIIKFPADSILISSSSNNHIKLLVPPDMMTIDQISKFSYGLTNVQAFVKSNFHQTSQLEKTINPNEDCIFYIVLLSHFSSDDKVVRRTGLFLKEQNFFYRLTIDSLTSKLIPCGQIIFDKKDDN